MKCPHCGTTLKDDAAFCKNCGAKVNSTEMPRVKSLSCNEFEQQTHEVQKACESLLKAYCTGLEEKSVQIAVLAQEKEALETKIAEQAKEAELKILSLQQENDSLKNAISRAVAEADALRKEVAQLHNRQEELSALASRTNAIGGDNTVSAEPQLNQAAPAEKIESAGTESPVEKCQCPTCGAAIDNDMLFCGECGARLKEN